MKRPVRVAVLGGGISGLSAAHRLVSAPGMEVVVIEASNRLGGKIKTSDFDGRQVDEAADAFLTRGGQAEGLCRELGLDSQLVPPATNRAWLWRGDRLHSFPLGLALGVPLRPLSLLGSPLVSPRGALRAAADLVMPRTTGSADVSVARLVRRRLGVEVSSTLVEPLIGGINAGRAECLGVSATAPRFSTASERSSSLIRGLRSEMVPPSAADRATEGAPPPFLGLRGGMEQMVHALESALRERGTDIRLGWRVAAAARAGGGWILSRQDRSLEGDVRGGVPLTVHDPADTILADGIVVTLPAWEAAKVLGGASPLGSSLLGTIPYASVAMLTMSYDISSSGQPFPAGSGFLVPAGEHRSVTACSWTSSKWPHLGRPRELLVRASVGRWRDGAALMLGDDALVKAVHRELQVVMGLATPPTASRVTRWDRAFPQFGVDHGDLVARITRAVGATGPVELAGAAYGGVGIPSCVQSGFGAADRLLARL